MQDCCLHNGALPSSPRLPWALNTLSDLPQRFWGPPGVDFRDVEVKSHSVWTSAQATLDYAQWFQSGYSELDLLCDYPAYRSGQVFAYASSALGTHFFLWAKAAFKGVGREHCCSPPLYIIQAFKEDVDTLSPRLKGILLPWQLEATYVFVWSERRQLSDILWEAASIVTLQNLLRGSTGLSL